MRTSARDSYTNAIDLWALGGVLHEIVTGIVPFLEIYEELGPIRNESTVPNETGLIEEVTDLTVDKDLFYEGRAPFSRTGYGSRELGIKELNCWEFDRRQSPRTTSRNGCSEVLTVP